MALRTNRDGAKQTGGVYSGALVDREQLLAQSQWLRGESVWLAQRSAQVRARGQCACLASDALIHTDPRYRQEAERRVLKDAHRSVLVDKL